MSYQASYYCSWQSPELGKDTSKHSLYTLDFIAKLLPHPGNRKTSLGILGLSLSVPIKENILYRIGIKINVKLGIDQAN